MSGGRRQPLAEALALAEDLRDLLAPSCVRLEIAGSVRRQLETIGDLELVAIPRKRQGTQLGLFGLPSQQESVLWATVAELVADPAGGLERHPPVLTAGGDRRAAPWGERYRKLCWLDVPVDLFTTDEDAWGAQLVIRTGPAEYSQAWVTALRKAGLEMRGGWVRSIDSETIVPVPDEETAHALVGWDYVQPWARRR